MVSLKGILFWLAILTIGTFGANSALAADDCVQIDGLGACYHKGTVTVTVKHGGAMVSGETEICYAGQICPKPARQGD
ncbi:hypothetical protein [Desulfogranum mediterraneum]|uniref:hypothetical protein n=1 Tax=Desulfogranum mediterraneum TaxID=160661 RepID=UPI0012947A0B|nr:hypothetical protein [Desulfogranum mediterraneum]